MVTLSVVRLGPGASAARDVFEANAGVCGGVGLALEVVGSCLAV